MIYAILGIAVIVSLFLIFRNDHDNSYNKKEKGARQAEKSQYQKSETKSRPKTEQQRTEQQQQQKAEQPRAEKKAQGPSLKEQILGELEAAFQEMKKGTEEPMGMFREAMDKAKSAFDEAVKGAQKGWSAAGSQPDVDEQFPEEEADLAFLDTLDYYEDLAENAETFDIAGLRYHCTVKDCGRIVGIVKPEPSNVHDSRAQAVIRADGKLLGYIPRTQQDWYEEFNEANVDCPFVGEIEIDPSTASLIAEIKVIIPVSREFVQEEIEDGVYD